VIDVDWSAGASTASTLLSCQVGSVGSQLRHPEVESASEQNVDPALNIESVAIRLAMSFVLVFTIVLL